jgi:nicotinamidase/pyrazinamidase
VQRLWLDHCLQGTDGAALHPGLITFADDVMVHKGWQQHVDAYSAFFNSCRLHKPRLDGLLRRRGISTVVVVGLALDHCVKWTALDAAELGYSVLLVLEATRAVDREEAGSAVRELERGGVRLLGTVQEAVQLLRGVATGEPAPRQWHTDGAAADCEAA